MGMSYSPTVIAERRFGTRGQARALHKPCQHRRPVLGIDHAYCKNRARQLLDKKIRTFHALVSGAASAFGSKIPRVLSLGIIRSSMNVYDC